MKDYYNCPLCGGRVIEVGKFWGCENYRSGCNFKIFKDIYDIVLPEKTMEELLTIGETSEKINGFFDKKKSRFFSCRLRYDKKTNLLKFIVEKEKNEDKVKNEQVVL